MGQDRGILGESKAHPEVLNAFLSFEATKERHRRRHVPPGSLRSGYLDQ